jgi:hypothetical protein
VNCSSLDITSLSHSLWYFKWIDLRCDMEGGGWFQRNLTMSARLWSWQCNRPVNLMTCSCGSKIGSPNAVWWVSCKSKSLFGIDSWPLLFTVWTQSISNSKSDSKVWKHSMSSWKVKVTQRRAGLSSGHAERARKSMKSSCGHSISSQTSIVMSRMEGRVMYWKM